MNVETSVPILPAPKSIAVDDDWFEIVQISDTLFAIAEPRHYEHTIVYLLIGEDRAILIDTGCCIGNLRRVVDQLTPLPVAVVNTHTHLDHLGGNQQFSDIVMFDHPRSRSISAAGAPRDTLLHELLDERLITPPWPRGFDLQTAGLPPFNVSRWLAHGDSLEIGGIRLKVLHTPGEAPDHICLLDQTHRILFSGDILLDGPVWAHLEGGDVHALHESYHLLMQHYDEFDIIMPSHNAPSQSKDLLDLALATTSDILAGKALPQHGVDPWGRSYKRYGSGRISILTR